MGFRRSRSHCCCQSWLRRWRVSGWRCGSRFERNNQVDFADAGWAYKVGQADFKDVVESDGIFAVVNGAPPDEGVMVELGMAIALGKPTFLFRDDFRNVTDSGEYPLNLMLFTGMPQEGWRDYYYTSIEELASGEKALARWAQS